MKKNTTQEYLSVIRTLVKDKKLSDAQLLALHYLDEGTIDSFQFIELLSKLEHHFKIKFSSSELTSKEFRSFKGILSIIESRATKKKA